MASSPKDPVVRKDNNQSKIGYGEEGSAIKNKTPTIVKVNNRAKWNDAPTAVTTRPTVIRGTSSSGPGWQSKQYWPDGYYQITYNSSNLNDDNTPKYVAASTVRHSVSSASRNNIKDYIKHGDFVREGTKLYLEVVVPNEGDSNVWFTSSLQTRFGRACGIVKPDGKASQKFFVSTLNGLDPAPLIEEFTVNAHTQVDLVDRGNCVELYHKSGRANYGQLDVWTDIEYTPNILRLKYNGRDETKSSAFYSGKTLVKIFEEDLMTTSGWSTSGEKNFYFWLFEGGIIEFDLFPARSGGVESTITKVQSNFAASESELNTWDSSWPQPIDDYYIEKTGNGIWKINMSNWMLEGNYYQDKYTFSSDRGLRRTLGCAMTISPMPRSALYLSDTNALSANGLKLNLLDIEVEKAGEEVQSRPKSRGAIQSTIIKDTIKLTEENVGKAFKNGYVAPTKPLLLSPGDKVTITVKDPNYYIGTNYAYGFDTLYPDVGEPSTSEGVQTLTFTVPTKTTDNNTEPDVGYDILTFGLNIKRIESKEANQ